MAYTFIMIDGPDGAGKSTVLNEIVNNFQGKKLNLIQYWKENNGAYPKVIDANLIISAEPTYSLQGLVIRNELIKKGSNYPASAIAQAYALDRLILYKKIIIPALEKEIKVVQDRGISSSLVYQPLDAKIKDEELTVDDILNLSGNDLAMLYPPSHLLIIYTKPKLLIERLERREKKDESIFENLDFQIKLTKAYLSTELKHIFEKHGTKVIYLENSSDIISLKSKIKFIEDALAPKTKG